MAMRRGRAIERVQVTRALNVRDLAVQKLDLENDRGNDEEQVDNQQECLCLIGSWGHRASRSVCV